MRTPSSWPNKDGGWMHTLGSKPVRRFVPPPPKPVKELDAEKYFRSLPQAGIELGESLGVNKYSLTSLDARYSKLHESYAFAMRDAKNKIIGIRLRFQTGEKKAVTGSRQGLFIPQIQPAKTAFIVEGPTDTMALLTMGFYAIGKPNCNGGHEMLADFLQHMGIVEAVIVADNDSLKKNGTRPGLDGAKKLQMEISVRSCIIIPPSPIKDVRQLLNKVGAEKSRAIIESLIKNQVWKK